MKKNILGGIVALLLVVSASLLMYIFTARTTSDHKIQQFDQAVGFLEERIDAMEKQRTLMNDSAASMEQELAVLQKRIQQIDVEIQNMRELVDSARTAVSVPLFRPNAFRLTTGSGLVVVAFLAFILLLYSSARRSGEQTPAPPPAAEGEPGETLQPGSVLEEEYSLQQAGTPSEPAGEAPAAGTRFSVTGSGGAESKAAAEDPSPAPAGDEVKEEAS